MVRAIKVLTMLTCFAPAAGAQAIRGVVVDASDTPVRGVVILLLDSTRSVTGRALSNENGEFRLVAPRAGTYRVRTLRIGFRPMTTEPVTVGEADVSHRLVLTDVPFALDTVRVAGRNNCEVRPEAAAATFAVWDQARAALTAAQLTARTRTIGARIVTFERKLHPSREVVLQQQSRVTSGLTSGAWNSLPVDSLRKAGYVVTEYDGSLTYYAPDLAVLVSDPFIEDHCLRLSQRSDTTDLGIDFEPTRDRGKVPEIAGTMWLDRRTSELRRMEFRYVNLGRALMDVHAGGTMQFARMGNGAWVISRWSIRMPVVEAKEVAVSAARRSGATTLESRVMSVREEGGELAMVTRGRDTLWSRPPLALKGTVLDSASGSPVAGARVVVRGTSLEGKTDPSGQFRIPDVLPGEYTVDVSTRTTAAFGITRSLSVTFADSANRMTIRVPNAEQLAAMQCAAVTSAGLVAGTVRARADSAPKANVRVVGEWREGDVQKRDRWVEARTDARGTFRLCGVPTTGTVTLRVEADSGAMEPLPLVMPAGQRIAVVDLMLDRRATVKGNAVLAGVVRHDANLQPLADVEVVIPALSRSTFTNAQGQFRLNDIPPGTQTVELRRVGYRATRAEIAFTPDKTVEREFVVARVVTLDTVAVSTSTLPPDFEEHRKAGLGSFITRAEIRKAEGRPMSDVVAQLPGMRIVTSGRYAYISTRRKGAVSMSAVSVRESFCYSQVWVNNAIAYAGEPGEPLFDINSLLPGEVEGIEFYRSAAETPLKYTRRNSPCGVVVIHLRRGK